MDLFGAYPHPQSIKRSAKKALFDKVSVRMSTNCSFVGLCCIYTGPDFYASSKVMVFKGNVICSERDFPQWPFLYRIEYINGPHKQTLVWECVEVIIHLFLP